LVKIRSGGDERRASGSGRGALDHEALPGRTLSWLFPRMPRAASVSLPPPALSSWSGDDAMTNSAKTSGGGRASKESSQTSHENQAGEHGMRSSAEDHLASRECMDIDAGGATSRDDGNSAAGCLGSRNRKPSRRLQEAVHDYEVLPCPQRRQLCSPCKFS
jgi:hypothetical protein